MATFAPFGLKYYSSLASPANNATAVTTFEWDPTFSGVSGSVASIFGRPEDNFSGLVIPQNCGSHGDSPDPYTSTFGGIGVINGFKYTQNNTPIYGNFPTACPAYIKNTANKVYVDVITDPFAIYEIQSNSETGLQSKVMGQFATIPTTLEDTTYQATYPFLPDDYIVENVTSTNQTAHNFLSKDDIYPLQLDDDTTLNTIFQCQIIGLAPGSVWYDPTKPDPDAAYNSVLVVLVNNWFAPSYLGFAQKMTS